MVLALALAGCRAPLVYDTPIPLDDALPRAQPSDEEWVAFDRAAVWSADRGGLALVVVHRGRVVYETYQGGHQPEEPVHLHSGTTLFSCLLIGAAAQDGLLDLDSDVGGILGGMPQSSGAPMLVRHLLAQTSGVDQDWEALTLDGLFERQRVEDKYAYALTLPRIHDPGAGWEHGASHWMLLGAVLQEALDDDPVDWLQTRIFDPVGFRTSGWHRDPAGNPMLAYGAWTTASEWSKIGLLVEAGGVWNGVEVLEAERLAACTAPGQVNPAYGHGLWRNATPSRLRDAADFPTLDQAGPVFGNAPADTIAALGEHDQRLYVIPSRDLVIIRLGNGHRQFRDSELLDLVLDAP